MAHVEKRLRKNGRPEWRARYRTPSGGHRSKSFDRKVDAERFLATVESTKSAGSFVDPSRAKVTVGEWSTLWLAGQTQVKPTTFSRYEAAIRRHIAPRWVDVQLADLTHAEVQAWVTSLTQSQSPASVQKIYRVLSQIIDMAVQDGRLARNVAAKVNLPRPTKHEKRYLTHSQVDALAQATGYPADPSKHSSYNTRENEMYRLVVLFLAYTGVRFGEMAALKVRRLDLVRRRAVIAESVTPVQGMGLVWGTPKSHQRREVSIPRFLVADLAKHTEDKEPDDLVFGGIRNGQPLRVSTFRGPFSVAAAAIGIPDLYPHALRHTAASLAIASGADVKVVQRMLGHASATMTLDTYGHLFEDRLDEVAIAMEAARTAEREKAEAIAQEVAESLRSQILASISRPKAEIASDSHNHEDPPSRVSAGHP